MGQKSKFLDSVMGQEGPRPAADQDPIEGGDALTSQAARRSALMSDETRPRLNGGPGFSTGPRAVTTSFPAKSDDERKAP